LLKFLLAKLF